MLSVIIASKDQETLKFCSSNIANTIGNIEFEILSLNNSKATLGLAELYNVLAGSAKFSILLFLHEDVKFYSLNWGEYLYNTLSDQNIGLVGLIGSNIVTAVPSGWAKQDSNYNLGKVWQTGDDEIEKIKSLSNAQQFNVKAIDGVFMATRKEIWEQIPFSEERCPGFHGYDLDYSLSIAQRYNIVVTTAIQLEHFSKGNFSEQWVENTIKINQYWKGKLPLFIDANNQFRNLEFWQANFMLNCISKVDVEDKKHKMNYVLHQFYQRKLSRLLLYLKLRTIKKQLLNGTN
jgi:hypothetical protein